MPASYTFDGQLARAVFRGETSTKHVLATMDGMFGHRDYPADARFLLDITGSTSLQNRSRDDIQAFVEYVAGFKDQYSAKIAVLVGAEVQYGLMRMGSVFGESVGIEMHVFRRDRDALQWLGIPPG